VPDSERKPFRASRMHLARKRKGLSKTEFADKIGVDIRVFCEYDSDTYHPSQETVQRMGSVTGFPGEFFYGEDVEMPALDIVSFRSLSTMSAREREMALSQGAIALLLNRWIEERFELPQVDLPDLSQEPNPEAAAMTLREHWGLGARPIRNMIHLLEERGVRPFSLAIDTRTVDAFSLWKEERPFVFLNTQKSCEHSRHDAAHELGHLVLHKHGGPRGREAETQAHAFASSFLMPRSSVLANAPKFPSLNSLISTKKIWTTSVASLNYRLHAVGAITDWQYRTLCVQIARRGYRVSEPSSAPRESSQILPKVFAALHEDGISRRQISKELFLPPSEFDQLIFGLTISSIAGGGKGAPGSKSAKLELVN
jgi:Zn-dependent peptidase ImmA (M78 family)